MIGIFTADIKWALFSEFQENALNIYFYYSHFENNCEKKLNLFEDAP